MDLLRRSLPFVVSLSFVFAAIFISEQQLLRIGANDPQIQLAEDTAAKLSTQSDTIEVNSLPRVDMSKSLASFVIIYDANGKVISSSGEIDGKIPMLPTGVLAYTREHVDDRFTWSPQSGVRIAAVVKYFKGRTVGYVLAGRSLREVENRIETLQVQLLVGYFVTLFVTLVMILLTPSLHKKNKH